MKRYTRKIFGYVSGFSLIIASPQITEYIYEVYTYLGGSTSLPFLDSNQSTTVVKYGLEALVLYAGIKLIVNS